MGVTDAPQWLPAAFARSAAAVGASAPREELEAHARELLHRWSDAGRHHHGVRHLTSVLMKVDELAEETHHPDLVRLAVWYHGIVFSVAEQQAYRRAAGEDEVASAEVARTELARLGLDPDVADRVAELVLHLRGHDVDKADIDQLALADAHLAILAKRPQEYRAYRETVRREYDHLPTRHYVQARIAIAERLLGRRAIFSSPMASAWEQPARENLTSELALLRAELAELGDCGPEGDLQAAEASLVGGADGAPRASVGTDAAPGATGSTAATGASGPDVAAGSGDGGRPAGTGAGVAPGPGDGTRPAGTGTARYRHGGFLPAAVQPAAADAPPPAVVRTPIAERVDTSEGSTGHVPGISTSTLEMGPDEILARPRPARPGHAPDGADRPSAPPARDHGAPDGDAPDGARPATPAGPTAQGDPTA
ncbi:MAG: hypothetical protein ACTHW4_00385, partial [Actinomycetales bacterium]